MPAFLKEVFDMGYAAVEFFFVLSGFILAYSYLGRSRPVPAKDFWFARFARVYPVYLLAMAIAIPLFVDRVHQLGLGILGSSIRAVLSFAMLQSWHSPSALDYNTPSWSLSVEAFFYALFPFILPRLARLPRRHLLPSLVSFAVTGIVVGVVATLIFPGATPENADARITYAKFFPLVHLPAFLFGAILGRLFLERRESAPSSGLLVLLGVGSVVTLISIAFVPGLYLVKHSGGLIVPFGVLIWTLAHERGLSARVLAWPPLVLLGEASYGIYILHAPALYWWTRLNERFGLHFGVEGRVGKAMFLAVISVLAVLVYRSYELPSREWIRAKFTRLNARPVA